jgi:hypothetical protein
LAIWALRADQSLCPEQRSPYPHLVTLDMVHQLATLLGPHSQDHKNSLNALLFSNHRAFSLVLFKWPVREIKAMFPAIEEVNRLKAVERAAHARLDRLNRTCPATDEVIKVAEEYWKEAAESLRDFQGE